MRRFLLQLQVGQLQLIEPKMVVRRYRSYTRETQVEEENGKTV